MKKSTAGPSSRLANGTRRATFSFDRQAAPPLDSTHASFMRTLGGQERDSMGFAPRMFALG